ncbi:MAG: hypothetical protein HYS61_06070 [Acidobacteria bacterium]|nr:hypothetical protein [Acidobacteriota bacterium]
MKNTLRQLENFIRKLHADSGVAAPPPEEFPQVFFTRGDLGGLMLWGDDASEYRSCLQNFWSAVGNRVEKTISLKEVETIIQVAILEALDVTESTGEPVFESRLAKSVEKLRSALGAQTVPWEAHLEVVGLGTDGLPSNFGGIEFHEVNDAALGKLAEKRNLVTAPEAREKLSKWHSNLDGKIKGKTYACVTVRAVDSTAALHLAKKRLRLVLDAVNFYADCLLPRGMYLCLPGDAAFVSHCYQQFRGGPRPGFFSGSSLDGPPPHFSLKQLFEGVAMGYGIQRVSGILEQEAMSDLEERILSALQWAGRASVNERREEAFLQFAIGLEVLLLRHTETELTYRLSLRAAHLLLKDFEGRKDLGKKVRDLYRVRSRVVHSGTLQVTDADLYRIRYFTKSAILALLTKPPFSEMKTDEELEHWFENQMLGGLVAESQAPTE